MAGNFVSDNCRVVPIRLTATTLTTVLDVTGFTQVIGVRIVNISAVSTPTINLQYKPTGSAISYYLQANYVLPLAGSLWFAFDAFGVKEGDLIQVQSSIASTVDVLVLIAEIPGRSA